MDRESPHQERFELLFHDFYLFVPTMPVLRLLLFHNRIVFHAF